MSAQTEPLLEVRELWKEFPLKGSREVVHAVNGVTLRIYPGETLALIGESGSGKTTVGRCVVRLLKPTHGEIVFRGQEITRLADKRIRPLRRRIQLVFQEPYDSLNPRMKADAIVEEPLRLAGVSKPERRERVCELFDLVQLEHALLEAYPHEISGGEQQRLGIARAISTSPDLVVLDEPTSALDVSVRAEILDLLRALQERLGIAYLFISHDLTAVRAISHRIAVMYLGRIIEEASTQELFARQGHPYSKALLASVLMPAPDVALEPVGLSGEIPSPIHLPTGCHLHPRCPFVVDRCRIDVPPLATVGSDLRTAACWRSTEVLAESSSVPEFDARQWEEGGDKRETVRASGS